MEIELTLVWAIIVTITLGIIVTFLIKLRKKHDQDIRFKEDEIEELATKLGVRQIQAYKAGVITTTGDYSQILGEFALLSKYDHIITLSTTSQQPSLDLIGINEESIDFLEIKKKGASISPNENRIKKLIDEKKVSYKIFDVDLPGNFSIKERTQIEHIQKEPIQKERTEKKPTQKKEAQKKYPNAYEPWTKSDDEILKNYWNDKSNKRSRYFKIKELSEKLGRQPGAINSRLFKMELDEYRKKEEKSSMHQLD